MEYKLDLLQKRVNHLEDLILSINDKIGVVLNEFLRHRAKQAADLRQKSLDEETLCLSLLSKFKSSFEVLERRNSGSSTSTDDKQQSQYLNVPTPSSSSVPDTVPVSAPVQLSTNSDSTSYAADWGQTGTQHQQNEVPLIRDQEQEEEHPINEGEDDRLEHYHVEGEDGDHDQADEEPEDVDGVDIVVEQVFGNYSYPEAEANSKTANNSVEEEDDDDVIAMDEDPLNSYAVYADDPATPAPVIDDEVLSLLCDPEVVIKTEGLSFQPATPAAAAGAGPEEIEHQSPSPMHIEIEEPQPEEDTDQDQQRQEGGNVKTTPAISKGYRRAGKFKSLEGGRLYLKVHGMIPRGYHDLVEARHYYYRCKDKNCPKLMYLAESYMNGEVTLHVKIVEHNHPPIRVDLRTLTPTPKKSDSGSKHPKANGNSETVTVRAPTFKLIQTFVNHAEAMAKIQAQDPGAWILNQVVECPDSVKAYYNCGLHRERSCPMSMVLRTFTENGKVDQYVWQGEHVHDANSTLDFADYFTPPETVSCHSGRNMGRKFRRIGLFETVDEARAAVVADREGGTLWDLRNTQHNITGKKLYFYCKRRKCSMTMYVHLITLAGKVFQYLSEGEHDHTQPEIKPKYKSAKSLLKARLGRGGHPLAKDWAVVASFASENEGRAHVRNELAWKFRNSYQLPDGGKKMYYNCKYDHKCPVRCVLKIKGQTGVAEMCVTTKEAHVHKSAPRPMLGRGGKKIKLAPELRAVIDELYAAGLATVDKILKELERRGTPAPAYHVLGYLARLRKAKYGKGRGGRRPNVALPLPGRILSGNPRNERARKAQAEAAAAKRVTASSTATAMGLDSHGGGSVSLSRGGGANSGASAGTSSPMRISMVGDGDSAYSADNSELIRQVRRRQAVVCVKRIDL